MKKFWKNYIKYLDKKDYRYETRLHKMVIMKLGGKCVVCGFKDMRALQLDHINGGGVKEIKKIGRFRMLSDIMELDITVVMKKYQVLCANCNWIKRSENKEVRKMQKKLKFELDLNNKNSVSTSKKFMDIN